MFRSRRTGRRLAIEALEHRTMLAGNVTASVVGKTLFLQGDGLDNNIVVENASKVGQYVIKGVTTNDIATKINGQTGSVLIKGATYGFVVNLGDGDNRLVLGDSDTSFSVPKYLYVTTGSGNDTIALTNVYAPKTLTINAGEGDNSVTLENVYAKCSLAVTTGAGVDELTLLHSTALRNVILNTGAGDDTATMKGLRASNRFVLAVGDGDDEVTIERDTETASDSRGHCATIAVFTLGAGADTVSIQDSSIAKNLYVSLEDGDDSLYLDSNYVANKAVLYGGQGNDSINSDFRNINALVKVTIAGFDTNYD